MELHPNHTMIVTGRTEMDSIALLSHSNTVYFLSQYLGLSCWFCKYFCIQSASPNSPPELKLLFYGTFIWLSAYTCCGAISELSTDDELASGGKGPYFGASGVDGGYPTNKCWLKTICLAKYERRKLKKSIHKTFKFPGSNNTTAVWANWSLPPVVAPVWHWSELSTTAQQEKH